MKKILISAITFVIMFNFIFCYHAYADEDPTVFSKFGDGAAKYLTEDTAGLSETDISDLLDSGQAGKTSSNQFDIMEDKGLLGTVAGLFGFALSVLPVLAEIVLALMSGNMLNEQLSSYFTVEKVVFNQVGGLDSNFFNYDDTYNVGDITITIPEYIRLAKENVAGVYFFLRYVAMALSLVTLIYIGIRMAISTVAEEQAKYKKMFIGWLESIIILMLLQYIISAMFFLHDVLMNICWEIYQSLNDVNSIHFEEALVKSTFGRFKLVTGVGTLYLTVSLWVIAYVHAKFFWIYLRRLFMTGILISTSPLIIVTYPIDKAGDGKAQAFGTWIKELIITCLIQPIHCVIYMVFNETAGEISKVAPILALVFLVLITYVEKIVRKILFAKDNNIVVGALDDVSKGMKSSLGHGGLAGQIKRLRGS